MKLHVVTIILKDYAKSKLHEDVENPGTEGSRVKINPSAQKSLEDIATIHHVLDVIKSMFRLSEEMEYPGKF